jgi:hypothetical protein
MHLVVLILMVYLMLIQLVLISLKIELLTSIKSIKILQCILDNYVYLIVEDKQDEKIYKFINKILKILCISLTL